MAVVDRHKKNQGWLLREPAFLSVNRQQKWFCHFGKLSDQRDTYKIKEKESKVRANVSEKNQKSNFGNVQNLTFAFFSLSLTR